MAGRAAATELARRGHEVLVLSRRAPAELPERASHRTINVTSGAGLAEGLEGLDALIDAVNATRDAQEVLVAGTRRAVAAAAAAGIGHVIGLSIVGADRVPLGYYRAKVAQEAVLNGGEAPWSILRATQFHGLIAAVFAAAAHARVVPSGRLPLQPVDPRDVAVALADLAERGPSGVSALAGPRIERLGELASTWRAVTGRRALALPIPQLTPALRAIAAGGLCDPGARRGTVTFEAWIRSFTA